MRSLALRFTSISRVQRSAEFYWELARAKLKTMAIPALAIGTLALGAAAGLLAAMLPLLPERRVKLLAGLPVVFVVFYSPHLLILLMLAVSSTVIDSASTTVIARFTAVELCLLLLLGLILARALSDRGENALVRTPLDWPIFLFFVASVISLLNAKYILRTYNFKTMAIWRVLFDYMVFFAVTNFVRTRRQLMTLVGGMFVMATVVAALMIAQQAAGASTSIIPGIKSWTATALNEEFSGVARVSLPGSALVYVMLMPALILHVTPEYLKGRKWLSLIPVVLLPMGIAFTFDRNMWIGATLAAIAFILISRIESKKFLMLIGAWIVVAAFFVPLAKTYYPKVDAIVEALSFRASSLFAGDELVYDSSTQWRLEENRLAIPKIQERPILGLGPGSDWRRSARGGQYWLTHYIHNAYLYLLLDLGIAGFLPFLCFAILALIRGFSSWRRIREPVMRGLVLGFTLSFIAVLSSCTTSPRLLEASYVPLIGVMLGINEVIIRLGERTS